MNFSFSAKTNVGRKREHNEDFFLVDEDIGLFVVADGMGGHAAGEIASQEAAETLHDYVLNNISTIESFNSDPTEESCEKVRLMLQRAVQAATYQVFGMPVVDSECKGLGTTLSALLLLPQSGFIAHVGDSRIYIIRGDRHRLATSDHTYLNSMVEQGKMTLEEAHHSRYSHLLMRSVGSFDYVEVDTRIIRYQRKDMFLLCTDGLHNYLDDREFNKLIKIRELHKSTERLVNMALERGGSDNITVILVRVD
jgi:serine/threonine protein phosphatase PrpC